MRCLGSLPLLAKAKITYQSGVCIMECITAHGMDSHPPYCCSGTWYLQTLL